MAEAERAWEKYVSNEKVENENYEIVKKEKKIVLLWNANLSTGGELSFA